MEPLSRVNKSEEKVKNVFKQLLERLSLRKAPKKHGTRISDIPHYKKDLGIGRRLSVGNGFQSQYNQKKIPGVLSRSIKSSYMNEKKEYISYSRRVPIKGSMSNRCKTEQTPDTPTQKGQNQTYNQLLITKSYIFSGLAMKKKAPPEKIKGVTCSNFSRKNETCIKQFKRDQHQHRKHVSFIGQQEEKRSQTEYLSKMCDSVFEPWETDDHFE